MENGTTFGTWVAYAAIIAFLILLVAVFLRTMMLFATLTLMPLSRVGRWLLRLGSRGDP